MTNAVERARIIVVEDEALTRESIARVLSDDGHEVRMAADVFACRAALKAQPADIVILDLGLPGLNGMTLTKELSATGVGLIIVTILDDRDARIAALDDGADDYVLKPIDLAELAARVRSLLRRRAFSESPRLQFGGWTMDLRRRTLTHENGAIAALTRGEFDLLARLAEAGGKIVSRDVLSEAVTRSDGRADPRSVDALVSRIRKKMGGDLDAPPPIVVTAAGFGYRLGVPVRRG